MDWCCRSSLFGDRLRLNKAQSEIKHVYTYAETIRKVNDWLDVYSLIQGMFEMSLFLTTFRSSVAHKVVFTFNDQQVSFIFLITRFKYMYRSNTLGLYNEWVK